MSRLTELFGSPDTSHATHKLCAPRLVTFYGALSWHFVAIAVLFGALTDSYAGPLDETRYCGEPKRNAKGEIVRRADVLAAFKKAHPCPATGLSTGSCPGWQMDHTIPLKCGGCDSVSNLAWLPVVIKAGPGQFPKDRWELKVYCSPQELVPMPEKPLPLVIVP